MTNDPENPHLFATESTKSRRVELRTEKIVTTLDVLSRSAIERRKICTSELARRKAWDKNLRKCGYSARPDRFKL